MQALPESRQQTFEEIYGAPENFLEIEVRPTSLSLRHYTSVLREYTYHD
jgi:hypothetical protein